MTVLKFFRKLDIMMYKMGKAYGLIFKLIIPFFVMLIPFDQMLGLIFGAEYIVFFIPIIDVVKVLEVNPLYLGTYSLDIIGGAFLAFAVILVFFPKVASAIEFILLPSYVLFLYVILNWQFNTLGLISLIAVLVFLGFKILTFVITILRKIYNIKPMVNQGYEKYGYY